MITLMNQKKSGHTKENLYVQFCKQQKIKTSGAYDIEEKQKKETVNACDDETINEHEMYFNIYECGKNI